MATYPDDWGFELFIYLVYSGFTVTDEPQKLYFEGEFYPETNLPSTDNAYVVWYLDSSYTKRATENSFVEYISDPEDTVGVTYGSLTLYGKIEEPEKIQVSFKKGFYESYLFDNLNQNHLQHIPGTLYLAKQRDFSTSYLFYDDGVNFLNISPLIVKPENGGTGRDLSDIPAYATLIQGPTGLFIDYVESEKGAYYSTAASESPKFGTLPVSCGGTGNTTFTAYRPVYVSSTSKLASATSHYMSTTKFAVGTTTQPSTTFYVNGTTGLKGNTSITGTLSATGAVTFDSTLTTTGTATFNAVNINGIATIDNDLLVTGESSFQGAVIIDNTTYGTDLPETGTEGQIFFKLIEE